MIQRETSQEASNDEQDHTPSTLARGVGLKCENYRVKLKGMLVEQDSEVRVVSVHPELIEDVRNMSTGFLKNNRMKLPAGCGNNVGRISARRAWIPLKEGKAELMVHEIAVNCGNGAKSVGLGLPNIYIYIYMYMYMYMYTNTYTNTYYTCPCPCPDTETDLMQNVLRVRATN